MLSIKKFMIKVLQKLKAHDNALEAHDNALEAHDNALDIPKQYLWTPKIYDNETYKSDFPEQKYYKIGKLYILTILTQYGGGSFNTAMFIKNTPCNTILGGNIYISGIGSGGGDKTIQCISTGTIFIRPNIVGTVKAGYISGCIFGIGN